MASVLWIAYCMDCDRQLTDTEGNKEYCPECDEQDEEEEDND